MIYHAKAFKPVKFEAVMKSPEVMKEVEKLHAQRRSYEEPSSKKERPYRRTVQWPAKVEQLTTCKRNGVKFPDIGSFDPSFVEQQTRPRVRVLVKMLKNVKAGAQATVHYGNERWFKCACDGCWVDRTEIGGDSEEE
ncbi:Histone-lysine N-methyltransferase [Phytophthora cinnamomi]|uniref:Histone-lysine N-methyltransferase n=1 Tax=Phytophthora cinnamomi TaxID=4785 RepID=UPI00355A3F8C|nr:Histone-lysine N-methyltransferase [Phytophthora cinnamomi]